MQEVYVAPLEEARERAGDKKAGGLVYTQANIVVKGIINWLKGQGAFIILTHQLAQAWYAKGPVPGQWRARQNNQVPYMMEIMLRLSKTCNVCGGPECRAANHVGRTHWAQVQKFCKNTSMEGTSLTNPSMSVIYAMYTSRLLPGVPEMEGNGNGNADSS